MKITGYQLREAIKQWELRKDAASRIFEDCLKVFEGENKLHPSKVIDQLLLAETSIAKLQTVQAHYNLYVHVQFEGERITLCEAVKSLGGYSRVEKLWRVASGGGKKDRYFRDDNERDPTKQYAKQVVSALEGVEKATIAAKRASALRAAIATGNAEEVEMDLNPALLV